MATELRKFDSSNEFTQTRFWSGRHAQQCVQLTQKTKEGFQFVTVTRQQARAMAAELMLFAEGREVTEFEGDV